MSGMPSRNSTLDAMIERWSKPAPVAETVVAKPVSAAEIKQAIANRELVNFYQPQVAVATGAVIGVESLLRWRRGGEGIVGPGRFIGVAESQGLIEEITRYVLREALAQSRVWQDQGLKFFVSVNVSMDDERSSTFLNFSRSRPAASGLRRQPWCWKCRIC
jgi:EAL domain-containing protein (putative c-di-GMP-specific phosphodiesterase class I)